jgi:hypothetical protein
VKKLFRILRGRYRAWRRGCDYCFYCDSLRPHGDVVACPSCRLKFCKTNCYGGEGGDGDACCICNGDY